MKINFKNGILDNKEPPKAPEGIALDGLTRISTGSGHLSGPTLSSSVELSTSNQVLKGPNHRMEVNVNAEFVR